MAMLRWDPWSEVAALQRDVHQLLGTRTTEGARMGSIIPPLDAYRTDEGLVVHVELPGLQTEDVELTVEDGVLTITGERKRPGDVADDAWIRRERPVGEFSRSFTLPEGTDADAISASFRAGMLELRIPHPPARQPRKITIDTGDQASIEGDERQPIDVGEVDKDQQMASA